MSMYYLITEFTYFLQSQQETPGNIVQEFNNFVCTTNKTVTYIYFRNKYVLWIQLLCDPSTAV